MSELVFPVVIDNTARRPRELATTAGEADSVGGAAQLIRSVGETAKALGLDIITMEADEKPDGSRHFRVTAYRSRR